VLAFSGLASRIYLSLCLEIDGCRGGRTGSTEKFHEAGLSGFTASFSKPSPAGHSLNDILQFDEYLAMAHDYSASVFHPDFMGHSKSSALVEASRMRRMSRKLL
jgi:hypothetical protein